MDSRITSVFVLCSVACLFCVFVVGVVLESLAISDAFVGVFTDTVVLFIAFNVFDDGVVVNDDDDDDDSVVAVVVVVLVVIVLVVIIIVVGFTFAVVGHLNLFERLRRQMFSLLSAHARMWNAA